MLFSRSKPFRILKRSTVGELGRSPTIRDKMAPSVLSKYFSDVEVRSLQSMYSKGEVDAVILQLRQKAEDLPNVEINIAVLGDVGCGKSTFINALRGLQSDDPGAVPIGNDEASMVPTRYSCPSLPNVQLWDLPGSNSFGFELKRYLKQVQFERYDFYIIVSQSRFRECDGEFSKKIQEQQKGFYYIRAKIDNDAFSMQMQGVDFNEGQRKIHEDCVKNFQSVGVTPPAIFLISSFEVQEYDFPKLKATLAKDLRDIKTNVFSLAIPKMMQEIQGPKRKMLMWRVWLWVLVSAALGAVRAPGLPLLTAIGCTVVGWIHLRRVLGIRYRELRNLSSTFAKPLSHLKTEKWHRIIPKILLGILTLGCTVAGFTDSFSPVTRSLCGAVSSFAFTFLVLEDFVHDQLQSGQNVARSALPADCSDRL